MPTERFPIRLGRRSRPLLRIFGVRGVENAYVQLDGADLDAHFGFANVHVPLSNITSWRIEGPWRWITAIGVRMSIRHRDVTFGGSPKGGVRLDFKERVTLGPIRMPALYVTVEDLEGLAAALEARGIAGIDARKDHTTAQ
jgi:hypothetical protein